MLRHGTSAAVDHWEGSIVSNVPHSSLADLVLLFLQALVFFTHIHDKEKVYDGISGPLWCLQLVSCNSAETYSPAPCVFTLAETLAMRELLDIVLASNVPD